MIDWRNQGIAPLLERSADVIDEWALVLKNSSQVNGRWPKNDKARAEYDDMRALAKQLRKAAAYHRPNPLGGPARVFDAIADRIRAGDPIESVMEGFRRSVGE